MMTNSNIVMVFVLLAILISLCKAKNSLACNEKEKKALLSFKQALTDPGNRLSSWSSLSDDCCRWEGVRCSNTSGSVVVEELNLGNPYIPYSDDLFSAAKFSYVRPALGGEISPALLELEHLHFLNLSLNDFGGALVPSFLGSMRSLTYLNLWGASFGGPIPHQLGNLSTLRHLVLGGGNSGLYVDNFSWISHLSSLDYLYMSWVDFHRDIHWLDSLSPLSSLSELYLPNCQLNNMISSQGRYLNLTSLTVLSLHSNNFNHNMPKWLFNLTSLSGLSLRNNSLSGPIPSQLGYLSSLSYLFLGSNKLNGSLPRNLGLLSNLVELDIQGNSIEGTVSEVHFTKLSKLKALDMSSTSVVFNMSHNWIPPFQLEYLSLSNCKVGPRFPVWLRTQASLQELLLSDTGIIGRVPNWFWKWASNLQMIYLTNNQMYGDLSQVVLNTTHIYLDSNSFTGQLPNLSPNVITLAMYNNSLSGQVSSFLCQKMSGRSKLAILDLANNALSGELVGHCLMHWQSLIHLDLGSNNLSGKIPESIGSLFSLKALHLYNNSFSGGIPLSLRNCTILDIIDFAENKLTGNIPSWIGERADLMVIGLRSNEFSGDIPQQICQLSSLIVLDLADNKLSGSIPKCLNNITAMTTISDKYSTFSIDFGYKEGVFLKIKGSESEYDSILPLVRMVDFSGNNLSGGIPTEISSLLGLQYLNLSRNHLIGRIPEKIGDIKYLESLGLSNNNLTGEIPQSITNLTFLGRLDLSYNNLSGRIPLSTQLQSFDAADFIGNPQLCGAPLLINCTENEGPDQEMNPNTTDENVTSFQRSWFYIGAATGFIVSFWGVCGSLLCKRAWRHAWFMFLDEIKDQVYVVIVLNLNRFRNHFRRCHLISLRSVRYGERGGHGGES